ncbi:unnamed protein product, partial [Soboliphyme baturini]|uniref:Rubis-subs-bind domain-containing protein n=1 Tax=Soboliphyme baturini TaxID=241478 RepID=A0A183J9B0_9BILA
GSCLREAYSRLAPNAADINGLACRLEVSKDLHGGQKSAMAPIRGRGGAYEEGFVIEHTRERRRGAKSRALLAAWIRRDKMLMESLLELHEEFTVLELLKVATLLDSDRSSRCLERRMACLKRESAKAGQKGKSRLGRKIDYLKREVNNRNMLKIEVQFCS